jgi:hypothetical protein
VDGTGSRACTTSALFSAASRVTPTCGDKPGHDELCYRGKPDDPPVLSAGDIADLIAFLDTLRDGYRFGP